MATGGQNDAALAAAAQVGRGRYPNYDQDLGKFQGISDSHRHRFVRNHTHPLLHIFVAKKTHLLPF